MLALTQCDLCGQQHRILRTYSACLFGRRLPALMIPPACPFRGHRLDYDPLLDTCFPGRSWHDVVPRIANYSRTTHQRQGSKMALWQQNSAQRWLYTTNILIFMFYLYLFLYYDNNKTTKASLNENEKCQLFLLSIIKNACKYLLVHTPY